MNSISASGFDALTVDEVISSDYRDKHIPEWVDMTDEDLGDFAKKWISPIDAMDDDVIGVNDEFDYSQVIDINYVVEKFPGFDDFVYPIILSELGSQNDVVDGFGDIDLVAEQTEKLSKLKL